MAERSAHQVLVAESIETALSQPFYHNEKPIFSDPIPVPEDVLEQLIRTKLLADHLRKFKVPTPNDFEKAKRNRDVDARVRGFKSRVHEGIALRTYANYLSTATDGRFVVIPGRILETLTRGFDFLNFEDNPTPENARKYRQQRLWTPDAGIADRESEQLIGVAEITRRGNQEYVDGKDTKLAAQVEVYLKGFCENPYCQFVTPIDSTLPVSPDRLFQVPYEDEHLTPLALRASRAQSVLGLPVRGKKKASSGSLKPAFSSR